MFSKSAAFYDAVYAFKDYAWECERLVEIVGQKNPEAGTLLDVACGTGMHLFKLKKRFECDGLDLDENLLAIAKARNPEIQHHLAAMADFNLGKKFDVVTCLFGSIGYSPDVDALEASIACMRNHLNPKGLLIVEPWLTREKFQSGHLGSIFIDKEDLKLARVNLSRIEGRQSVIDFHYLVGTHAGIEHMVEEHRLTLFTTGEYLESFQKAGLIVEQDAEGLMGRGLFVGQA